MDILEILNGAAGERRLTNGDLARRVYELLVAAIGTSVSANQLTEELNRKGLTVAGDTVTAYLAAIEGAGLFRRVNRYDIVSGRELKTNGKYYAADARVAADLVDRSAALENDVYWHLIDGGWTVWIGKFRKEEVDFVAERSGERRYLQVAASLDNPIVRDNTLRPLRRIPDKHPKLVVVGEGSYPDHLDGIRICTPAHLTALSKLSPVTGIAQSFPC